MKLGLIPPLSMLQYINPDMGLYLPELFRDEPYRNMLKQNIEAKSCWNILDNGAAEDKGITLPDLLTIVDNFDFDEIVIPDVIGDQEASMDLYYEAINYFNKHDDLLDNDERRMMVVLQGRTVDELIQYGMHIADTCPYNLTLGIPRSIISYTGNRRARIEIAKHFSDTEGFEPSELPIHFLGASYEYPQEMGDLRISCINHALLRSHDTSAPFVYAYFGQRFGERGLDAPARRPADYFDLPASAFDLDALKFNIAQLRHWCGIDAKTS